MLKKIALVTLFVVTAVVGASSAVLASQPARVPVASTPHGLWCPGGMC